MNEETLFQLALEKPPHERTAFLDSACAGDTELRYRVDRLLLAHDNPGSFLKEPALDSTPKAHGEQTQAVDSEPIKQGASARTEADTNTSNRDDDLSFLTPSTGCG